MPAQNILNEIYEIVIDRAKNPKEGSYVCSLLKGGEEKILKKMGEECSEVIIAAMKKNRKEIIYEMADLWFHSLVLLGYAGIQPSEVYKELESRKK
jgi:phosphoribosyl-ATP pyrophosphohydrolase/phosphoribosyl-AMP cyclohydrolase